jgi:hypothetical protein
MYEYIYTFKHNSKRIEVELYKTDLRLNRLNPWYQLINAEENEERIDEEESYLKLTSPFIHHGERESEDALHHCCLGTEEMVILALFFAMTVAVIVAAIAVLVVTVMRSRCFQPQVQSV